MRRRGLDVALFRCLCRSGICEHDEALLDASLASSASGICRTGFVAACRHLERNQEGVYQLAAR